MGSPYSYDADFPQSEDHPIDLASDPNAGQYGADDTDDFGDRMRRYLIDGNNGSEADAVLYSETAQFYPENPQSVHNYSVNQTACQSYFTNDGHSRQADEMNSLQDSRWDQGLHPHGGISDAATHQHNPLHQKAEPVSANTHWIASGQPSYFDDDCQPIHPSTNERSEDAFDDLREYHGQPQYTYSTATCSDAAYGSLLDNAGIEYYTREANQYDNIRDETWSQFSMQNDRPSDNTGGCVYLDTVPVVGEDPWSAMNQLHGRPKEFSPQLDHWLQVVATSSEASRTSNPSNNTTNSLTSITHSVADSDGQDWGQNSEDTIRPGGHLGNSPSLDPRQLRHPTDDSNFQHMPNEAPNFGLPIRVYPGTPAHNSPVRAGPQRSSRPTSSRNDRLSVAPYHLPSSGPASPAGSTASDVFRCPLCTAEFSGLWGRGNWGRHNRNKHNGEAKAYPCPHCSKIFARTDARGNHVRKHHEHLAADQTLA